MIDATSRRLPRSTVRNTRIVRQPDRVQTRTLLAGLGLGLLVLVPLLANIWTHTEQRRLGYQLDQARDKLDDLKETRRLLRAEQAVLSDLNRIQIQASRDLGLQPRRPADTVVVRGGVPDREIPATARQGDGASGPPGDAATELVAIPAGVGAAPVPGR